MTTLDLAELIGDAVKDVADEGPHARARAVLDVLRETGHWFCRAEQADEIKAGMRSEVDVRLPWE